jgi:hypothetical protein
MMAVRSPRNARGICHDQKHLSFGHAMANGTNKHTVGFGRIFLGISFFRFF